MLVVADSASRAVNGVEARIDRQNGECFVVTLLLRCLHNNEDSYSTTKRPQFSIVR